MKQLLPKLTDRLREYRSKAMSIEVPRFTAPVPKEKDTVISHTYFWPRLAEFFRPKDVIVTETGAWYPPLMGMTIDVCAGTSNFGIQDVPLPEKSVLLSQIFWGSIGWSVGSCYTLLY